METLRENIDTQRNLLKDEDEKQVSLRKPKVLKIDTTKPLNLESKSVSLDNKNKIKGIG